MNKEQVAAANRLHQWLSKRLSLWKFISLSLLPDCKLILERFENLESMDPAALDVTPFECLQIAQMSVFDKTFLMSFSRWLRALPDKAFSKHSRVISTALMILKFPHQILLGDEISQGRSIDDVPTAISSNYETRNCFQAAKSVARALKNLLLVSIAYSTEQSGDKRQAARVVSVGVEAFLVKAKVYIASFEEWERYDSQRVASSLEESFRESYTVYLAAHGAIRAGEVDPGMVAAAEEQVMKISSAMAHVLGPERATNRLEELRASVEASVSAIAASSPSPTGVYPTTTQQQRSPHQSPQRIGSSRVAATPAPVLQLLSTYITAADEKRAKTLTYIEKAASFLRNKVPLWGQEERSVAGERLIHEIMLDRSFRLQPPSAESVQPPTVFPLTDSISGQAPDSVCDTLAVAKDLRIKILRVMGDKLVNSLSVSHVDDVEKVDVGMVIPVYFRNNLPEGAAGQVAPDADSIQVLSAKVTAVQRSSSDQVEGAAENGSASKVLSFSVQYLADGLLERAVAVERVKLSTSPLSSNILVPALQDLCSAIAGFTPNRPDIRARLLQLVDRELMDQMIVNRALHPARDLLPTLLFLLNSLESLQSPNRAESTKQYINDFTERFLLASESNSKPIDATSTTPTTTNTTTTTTTTTGARKGERVSYAALLPEFFEKCQDFMEEIQRDMANYFISVLVPMLYQSGYGYQLLRSMLSARLLEQAQNTGGDVLRKTQAMLESQVGAPEKWQLAKADLEEAGISFEGVSLLNVVGNAAMEQAIVARGLLGLLQATVRLDSNQGTATLLPESLAFDAERLSKIRDIVDKIGLECSIVITSRQILGKYNIRSRESDETEMQHRLDVLLSDKDARFATITTEVKEYIRFSVQRQESVTGSKVGVDLQELHEKVEKSLREVVAANNPVLQLFTKRIYKVLLRTLLKQPYINKLQAYSLNFKGQERNLSTAIRLSSMVFQQSLAIHSELYRAMIALLVTRA